MCHPARCERCGKPTWFGCGRHIEQALANVPAAERCACPRKFLARVFGLRTTCVASPPPVGRGR